eukprot:CAMPEP_0201601090 /NCGR_PEP_ID=MMETSP0492-20130828/2103_1 /ASSEMBLY_ACC=CAM_ASM_000837 /TAXON_ID=420259 /ORGANISM="Thalassiosira gravida, Strain GMp14c1" /LENGTH=230 /DNA_ID=CAMNT_0048064181 /DNA_START=41 /DNA_END=733 /DNA_ORIENTATION=+
MTSPTSEGNTTKPTLGYWKIRGLASAIRYQLAYSNVSYDQEVYEQGDGPEFNSACWFDVKHDQGLTYPNLPYLKDGSLLLTEAGAIQRYCAKKWCPELLCDDDAEMYGKAEMVSGVVNDIKAIFTSHTYLMGDGDKKELADAVMSRFARIAEELSGSKFLIGDRICCADFVFAELVEMMEFVSDGEIYKAHPSLEAYRNRMFELPNMKKALEEEKKLTFNNKCGKINNVV